MRRAKCFHRGSYPLVSLLLYIFGAGYSYIKSGLGSRVILRIQLASKVMWFGKTRLLTTISCDVRVTVGGGNAPLSWFANCCRWREWRNCWTMWWGMVILIWQCWKTTSYPWHLSHPANRKWCQSDFTAHSRKCRINGIGNPWSLICSSMDTHYFTHTEMETSKDRRLRVSVDGILTDWNNYVTHRVHD